jgi:hypothetical protein
MRTYYVYDHPLEDVIIFKGIDFGVALRRANLPSSFEALTTYIN